MTTNAASPRNAGRPPRSLRWELVATLAIVLAMASVSLSLALRMLERNRFEQQTQMQLHEQTRALAAVLEPLAPRRGVWDVAEVERILGPSLGRLGIRHLSLLRRLDDGRLEPSLLLGLPLEFPDTAVAAPEAVREYGGLIVAEADLRAGGPGASRWLLRVATAPNVWTDEGGWLATLVLALGVGAVSFVLGVALLELQALRPLRQIRTAVSEVTRGNLDARVPEQGPAELQSLARDVNRMALTLQERIEELAASREKLVRSDQLAAVGQVAAGVAHEIGNPLAAVLGYVDLLLDPRAAALDAEQRRVIERCRTQLERIQTTVAQLLDLSRPARGEPQSLRFIDLLRPLLALAAHDPRCAGVEFRSQVEPSLELWVDPVRLEQVLRNLIVNAAKAARSVEGSMPVVEVRAHREIGDAGPRVRIEVQDNGPGVPAAVRPTLFEPFVTTAKAGEGTGLGLAICRGLVEDLQGTLRCLPDDARPALGADGRTGATFLVEVPAAPNPDPAAVVEPSSDQH